MYAYVSLRVEAGSFKKKSFFTVIFLYGYHFWSFWSVPPFHVKISPMTFVDRRWNPRIQMETTHFDQSVEAPFFPRDFKHLIAQSIYEIFVKRQYAIIYIYNYIVLCYVILMQCLLQCNPICFIEWRQTCESVTTIQNPFYAGDTPINVQKRLLV